MKKYLLLLAGIVLSGCSQSNTGFNVSARSLSSQLPPGSDEIIPSVLPKVGRLYFSGEGERPIFVTPNGVVFNELCYDDFRLDKELKAISKNIFDDGTIIDKKVATQNIGGNVSFSTKVLKVVGALGFKFEGKRERTYTVTNAKKFSISDKGIDIVKSEIGDRCKQQIAVLKAEGREVILLLSTVKADSITDVTALVGEGQVNADLIKSGVGGSINRGNTETYSNVVLGIDPNLF
jgi:hypothetical protein